MTRELPTLREAYARNFVDQVKRSADCLRDAADRLESAARQIERPNAHAGMIAGELLHTLDWALANGSLSAVVRAAAEYDRVAWEEA
jgi:hypothetical protein